jgi:hypothetical protein
VWTSVLRAALVNRQVEFFPGDDYPVFYHVFTRFVLLIDILNRISFKQHQTGRAAIGSHP